MNEIGITVIQIFISLVVETIILGGLFTYISNKNNQAHEQNLKTEMLKIETGLKFIRDDIIAQIKESASNATK